MKKIDVVILHYNNAEDTIKYIENLRQLNWEGIDSHFIIVDNASPDGSGKQLQLKYSADPDVIVLLSQKNLGFAKGNNLGIAYAVDHFNSDFVAVSNNDIEILDPNFFQKLCQLYETDPFAVCGPDIYSAGKQLHQSPIRTQLQSCAQVEEELKDIGRKLKQLSILKRLHLYEALRTVKHFLGKGSGGKAAEDWETVQYGAVIHGAFFVLTKEYLVQYPGGLYPETFMYKEEDILAYLCAIKDLRIRFCPELYLLHYDGVATLKASGKRVNKYIFELEHTRNSAQKFLELMQKNGSERG